MFTTLFFSSSVYGRNGKSPTEGIETCLSFLCSSYYEVGKVYVRVRALKPFSHYYFLLFYRVEMAGARLRALKFAIFAAEGKVISACFLFGDSF